ncbi:cupredoxin domain-containing protein [Streptomyces inhibens]|uniref:cupredoxin domain-containing protein n=1 Tax=Streptomyces inhibens TaxID=2293571 RepID=UPI001EE7439C|nr:cupredoxin domain-containing protein [Streptomyces inhibens]UKY53458.1 cupredoxin domain-containing protein [Streptomyces inhibens]
MPRPPRHRPRGSGPVRLVVAASAVFLAALTGCSGGDGGTAPARSHTPTTGGPGAASPAGARITIKDFTFKPAALTVRPGARVTVVNQDSATHDVTATGPKAFGSGSIGPGRTVTFTAPAKPGRYRYICTIHPYMKGSLTVR